MAKKKNIATVKKLAIIGGILIVAQAAYIYVFSGDTKPLKAKDAIRVAISKRAVDIPADRREQMVVQLSIQDYMMKNGGVPPKESSALIPEYFDAEPIDRTTGKPFQYRVEGSRFFVGTPTTGGTSLAKKTGDGSSVEGEQLTKAQQDALIASLKNPDEKSQFIYDPTGKRDPFRPFNFSPRPGDLTNRTELETFDIGQLKLTAVITDENKKPTTAIVENEGGKGYTIRKGTKIGANSGEVVEILIDRLLILEKMVDFTGKEETKTVEMRIRTKDQERKK
jgi:Tfp pilus assembly protein PilP